MQKEDITEQNKSYISEFLDNYKNLKGNNRGLSVSNSRKEIFCRHIVYFLRHSKDLKKEMYDKKVINSIFTKLESELKRSTYATVVDVMLRFVKQLDENNVKPKGFEDIGYLKTEKRMDSFRSEDLLTWEDIEKMCNYTKSIQMKAILTILIDGGFRPSEFIDIKYNDVSRVNNSLVVRIPKGKTGSRDVVLWKSIPYVQDWLDNHPIKKADSPLWIKENLYAGEKDVSYKYDAVKKRIKQIAKKAKIYKIGTEEIKDVYGYAFRHACAKMYKKQNINPDWASANLGHSVKFYVETYGKEDVKDRVMRSERHQGISKKQDEEEQNKICSICGHINKPKEKLCKKCYNPLSLENAISELNELKRKSEAFKLFEELANNGDKLNLLKEALDIVGNNGK